LDAGPERATRVVVTVDAPALHDVAALCERVRTLLRHADVVEVTLDVRALVSPDAATVDALARVQLAAHRMGGSIRLRQVDDELRGLLALAGLLEVLCGASYPSGCSGTPNKGNRSGSTK
jgi:anti-anti-sigma regulatory factor